MLDALRKLDWAPRSVHRKARAAAAALREVEGRSGGEASESDVATEMGVSLTEYQRIVQDALGCQLLRLNDADDGEDSALDRLPDTAPGPQGMALMDSLRQAIGDAVKELPERERMVLSLYYERELNLKEIGVVLKVTESRVCQLHGQALLRLKSRLVEWRT
jgi:RNA polymerase sigma factor for flagellar operon FliA